jgi:hypothetical protein
VGYSPPTREGKVTGLLEQKLARRLNLSPSKIGLIERQDAAGRSLATKASHKTSDAISSARYRAVVLTI